jgi:outer membrane protein TolC
VQSLRRRFDTSQGAFQVGLLQPLPWGTRIGLDWANDFTATDNPFQNCIPGLVSPECYETQVRLTLTQPLLRGFGEDVNTAAIIQAEAQVDAARLEQRQTAEALVVTVIDAWAEVAYTAEAVEIRAQALALARQQLASTEAQIEVGRLAPADRPVVAQAVARATRELAVAEVALADRRATLATHLAQQDIEPAPFGAAEPFVANIDTAAQAAEAQNPAIAIRDVERRALETSLRVQEDSGRPRLDLTLVAAQAGISDRYGDALASLPDNDTHFYGATLDFAWAPANNTAEGEAARLRLAIRATEAEIEALRETTRIEVGQAVRAAIAADTTVTLDTEVAALADEAVAAERLKFESGRATNLDVLQVQQDLAEARLTVARAEADRLIARARVQQLTGTLLEAYGLQLAATE